MRVTEPYDVYSLLDDLEEYRFIDDETSIRIECVGFGGTYIATLKEIDLHRALKHQLPYTYEFVLHFTFYQKSNILYIKTTSEVS